MVALQTRREMMKIEIWIDKRDLSLDRVNGVEDVDLWACIPGGSLSLYRAESVDYTLIDVVDVNTHIIDEKLISAKASKAAGNE